MYVYTPGQWALLFFFYCFCGWVWESCYVSAKQRQWVNRGFLHGPLLPIYGSGAIIILFVTLPVADNLWLVYVLGMLAATLLEYVVGAVMEQLFKVRYWDYTKQPCNLHGYICLTSSIAWGFSPSCWCGLFIRPLTACFTSCRICWSTRWPGSLPRCLSGIP